MENTATRAEIQHQREQANQPGTKEHRELAEINVNIQRFNTQNREAS